MGWLSRALKDAEDERNRLRGKSMFIPVVAACCVRDGLILLQGREQENYKKDHLNFPGGKVEFNETLEQALGREIFEELGVQVTGSKLIYSQVNKYPGNGNHFVVLYYEVTLESEPGIIVNGISKDLDGNNLHWVELHRVINLKVISGTLEALDVIRGLNVRV